jgi:hyperosmotically inducible protein
MTADRHRPETQGELNMRHLNGLTIAALGAALVAAPAVAAAQSTQDKVEQKTERAVDRAQDKAERAKDTVERKADRAGDKAEGATDKATGAVSDTWITAKTKIALYSDDRVSGTQVNVDTSKGVVTLRGKVDSADAKAAAESVAKGIDGVRSVKNELQVVPPGDKKMVDAKDDDLQKAVERRLSGDPNLKKIDVRADKGVVTLTGEVPSVTASAKASEMARQVPGVRSVRNDLTFDRRGELRDRDAAADRTQMRSGKTAWTNGAARGDMARSDEVRTIQEALKDKGYDPGPVDGLMGPRTSSALREYQRTENLQVTGRLDDQTLSSLKSAPGKKKQSP